jgi:hypothetical protein
MRRISFLRGVMLARNKRRRSRVMVCREELATIAIASFPRSILGKGRTAAGRQEFNKPFGPFVRV